MPNYKDAPWNAPVEDEGRELSDADIPTRRRKPGEKREDVLTELIFGSYAEEKKEVRQPVVPSKTSKPLQIKTVPPKEKPKTPPPIKTKELPDDRRSRLLRELEELEKKEKEIAASLRTFEKTSSKAEAVSSIQKKQISPAPLISSIKGGRRRGSSSSYKNTRQPISSPTAKVDAVQKGPAQRITAALPIVVPVRTTQKKEMETTPQPLRMDGLAQAPSSPQVNKPVEKSQPIEAHQIPGPAEAQLPEPIPAAPIITPVEVVQPVAAAVSTEVREEAEQKIYDYYTKDHTHPRKKKFVKQAVLVSVAFVVVTGVMGVIDSDRLPKSFAFLSNISGFLRQSSFAITQENRQAFPELVQLYEATQEAQEQFNGSSDLEELSKSLETFLSSNSTFTWRALFAGDAPEISNVAELGNVLKQKKVFEAAHEHVLLVDSSALSETISWISFLSEIYSSDGNYLVLTTDEKHPTAAAGEPLYFAVVEIKNGRAQVIKSGSANDLNAALTTKIIPPKAVQGVKTDLDLYEAGWLYTFDDAAQLMTLMYEQTTQEKIDGVFMMTSSVAESLISAAGSSTTLSETWIEDLFKKLALDADLSQLGQRMKEEFARGALQLSFEENTLSSFARGKLNLTADTDTIDTLSVSARAWEGEGVQLSRIQYSPHFSGDGSIVGNARVNIKNLDTKPGRAYVKLYIPKQSMMLDASGFSQRVLPAPFDYGKNGFAQHALIERLNERESEEFVSLDLYDEGELMVVGGWISLPASGESAVTLSYRIPSRLDWRAGSARYDFSVLPVSSSRDVPFRFSGTLDEGVTFEWKDPLGDVTQQTPEFQKSLSSRLKLSSSLGFSSSVSNTAP